MHTHNAKFNSNIISASVTGELNFPKVTPPDVGDLPKVASPLRFEDFPDPK